jgi:hypothetical protein
MTWAAGHGQRLALRRVDLARHDRAARLVLRQLQLTQPATRARRQPAHVVGDLHQRDRQRLQRTVRADQRIVRRPARRSGWRARRRAGRCRARAAAATRWPNSGCVFSPVPTAVPPTASSCSGGRLACTHARAMGELRHPAGHFLPERERRGVLQMGAADLDDVGPTPRTSLPAWLRSAAQRRQQIARRPALAATCIAVGKMSFDDWPRFT